MSARARSSGPIEQTFSGEHRLPSTVVPVEQQDVAKPSLRTATVFSGCQPRLGRTTRPLAAPGGPESPSRSSARRFPRTGGPPAPRRVCAGGWRREPARGKLPSPRSARRRARPAMCRSIKTLFNFEPPATELEIRDASLQFVRKLSGFSVPSQANAPAFDRAVEEIAAVARVLIGSLTTTAEPRDREVEAARARAKAEIRFGAAR